MQPVTTPEGSKPVRLWKGIWRWLIILPLVMTLLYLCSLSSHLNLGYPVPSEIRSNIHATYAPWEQVVIQPVSTAILQDLPEWQDTSPEDLTVPGMVWVEPTITPNLPGVSTPTLAEPTSQPQPPVLLATRTPSPFVPHVSPISSTPTITAWLLPATSTRTATSTYITAATHTPTLPATPTRTKTPNYTSTLTTQPGPSRTYTLTPTFTQTPTLPPFTSTSTPTITLISTPTFTATITLTSTPTFTATITLTSTPTFTATITPTPTITPTATITQVPTPTQPPCGGNIPPNEPDIGPPDGFFASLPCGGIWIVDLPAEGYSPIDLSAPDSDYDLVFYERKLPPQNSTIVELDWVSVEIGPGPSGACDTSPWYMGLNWGDWIATNNGNLGSLFPEIDNQEIDISFLWGVPPLQTGVAIDLDDPALSIPAGIYPCIRVISPFNWPDNDSSEIDALEILP